MHRDRRNRLARHAVVKNPILNIADSLPLELWLGHGVLLAVSGGADSTALLRFMHAEAGKLGLARNLAVGHVDHGLRGEESDGDADFVRNIANELELLFFLHRIDEDDWKSDGTGSREAAARQIRYDFLLDTAHTLGFRYIATGHTADDRAETVLHRILRGTGLSGLSGIAPLRQLSPAVTVVRPLLDAKRSDLLEYLADRGQNYRTDSSNAENDFTRNKIRNRLLPSIREEFNPEIDAALNRLAWISHENDIVLRELVETALEHVVLRRTPESVLFDKTLLCRFGDATIRELLHRLWARQSWPLREMGFDQWFDLVDFFRNGTGSRILRGGVEAIHDGDRFTLRQGGANSEA